MLSSLSHTKVVLFFNETNRLQLLVVGMFFFQYHFQIM
ncbi:hypothetical protein SPWS13_0523 [Shewanella putrefaciens]|nr:hypothetical protein SPWS13_0523 [Shewanella putrefaciens]